MEKNCCEKQKNNAQVLRVRKARTGLVQQPVHAPECFFEEKKCTINPLKI